MCKIKCVFLYLNLSITSYIYFYYNKLYYINLMKKMEYKYYS